MRPDIWLGRFDTAAAWNAASADFANLNHLADRLDDLVLRSRHPFTFDAWCSACHSIQPMRITWDIGGQHAGSVHPAWTETAACSGCGLNSRMRALMSYLDKSNLPVHSRIYVGERVTLAYERLEKRYPHLIGSEYLGSSLPSGIEVDHGTLKVRHEDMTRLSFNSESFDAVITMDVFEHIPDYRAAFRECRRVLANNGSLIFTIPFFPHQENTLVRASIAADGSITHHDVPEYHGNPVGDGRSLCFQHFGWDLLDDLRSAGFQSAFANLYWGPWQGHLGLPFFVFHASASHTQGDRNA